MCRYVRHARLIACFAALALIGASGCSGSSGILTGKVTYNGQPLKGGNVALVPIGGGTTFTGAIHEDGTYTITNVRSGKYKVCVDTSSLKPPPAGFMGKGPRNVKNQPPPGANVPEGYQMSNPNAVLAENARRYVPIPETYRDPNTTPLTVEVTGGAQTHDIPLS